MTATADECAQAGNGESRHSISAGRVGRAHGLDGSFYVTGARARLLALSTKLSVAGRRTVVERRAGTDEHPIVRLEGIEGRAAAESLRGLELVVDISEAPPLEEGEWWANELEGCEVFDGERRVGTVSGLLELPSCEALEVSRVASHREPAQQGEAQVCESKRAPLDREREQAADRESPADRGSAPLLVPMVRDAIRNVDPLRRRIEVDMSFIEEA